MFKVVPDQLRISDGWVRCGQCDEIFDASANLVQETPGVAGQKPDANAHWALAGHTDIKPALAESRPTADVELASTVTAATPENLPDRGALEGADQALGRGDAQSGDARQPPDIAAGQVSFMQDGTARPIWGKTWVRVLLGLSCLVLLLGLGAQVAYVERDRIAAMEPATKPWLESLCEMQGCTVSPIQRIESIVIESSSFNKLRGDVYRLNFAVRSTASIEVGLPAVELALTDSQDQVLTRRVFLGPELGAKTTVLAPGAEWQVSWGVSVKGAGITDHISGYRILAFYP